MAEPDELLQVEAPSPLAFGETVERLTKAIEGAGMTVFARIDHAAGAVEAGMTMPPTLLLMYGNSRGGTPIMQAEPRAALDLPLRVLIREQAPGKVVISFHPIGPALHRLGVPQDLAKRLEPAQRLLLAAILP